VDFRACGLSVGDSIGMVLEVLKLTFDLRHAAGCGQDFQVGFRLAWPVAVAGT
jgi:hypothetical protein